jgi:hypothetical protein
VRQGVRKERERIDAWAGLQRIFVRAIVWHRCSTALDDDFLFVKLAGITVGDKLPVVASDFNLPLASSNALIRSPISIAARGGIMWRSAFEMSAVSASFVMSSLNVRITSRSTAEPGVVTAASSRITTSGAGTGSKRK